MQADRTYVFLLSKDGFYMNNTHEWCADGIEPEIANLQGIPSSAVPWWWSQFRDVGYVLVPCVDDMPPEAQVEYPILKSQNIRSVCVYPLHIGKELVGFMGNDSVQVARHWGPEVIEFLSLMSDLMGIALGHRQLHQKRALAISQLERAEQQAHLGHWYLDIATNKVTWSREVFRIFERNHESLAPDHTAYFEFVHPDDKQALHGSYDRAKATLSELNVEHRIVLDDGGIKHLEVRGRFESGPDGCPAIVEGTIQDVTEKAQHRESLQKLAYQDTLTKLPNLRSLEETLRHEMKYCERHDRRLVLSLLDLDNFRQANDQHGSALGDRLLKTLAHRMRRLFNDTVVIARVGGDEFVVLFTRLPLEGRYYQKLNRLLASISEPITIDGVSVSITASMGVTEFPQPMDIMGEQLLRQAQQALFQSKLQGKGRLHQYDVALEQDARALTGHLEDIQSALHAGEFVLYYQPKINMASGAVFGVEALVRWKKPTGELVPPDDFLPALYNHPLEVELGDWVMRAAMAQMQVWESQGLYLQVSVNVSSQQLLDGFFVEKLTKDLQDHAGISPALLQVEVLESSALNDLETVSRVMLQSRQLGVSFALDDFGTGYSSLAYLKHLPASVLKIDQSFVREMMESSDDLPIISGVVGMAKAFGLQVIAEGVESVEHGDLLLRLGCSQGQGYGIARPMPAADVAGWIEHWKAPPSWAKQTQVDTQNLPLLYAEVEHSRWVAELEEWLRDERDCAPVLDSHQCKVGARIDNEAQARFGLRTEFDYLVNVHQDLHSLGQTAVSLHAKGESEAALALLPEIQRLRDHVLTELKVVLEEKGVS
jgi:diguanylate cyclase (GGDEF)-like protein